MNFRQPPLCSNDKKAKVKLQVANSRILEDQRTLSLGMKFVELDPETETILGFFLLGQ